MATRTMQKRTRRPRTSSRTKQVVKRIKQDPTIGTLDVVTMFIPEPKFNRLSAEGKSEVIRIGAGLVDVVRAGNFDLRRAM